MRRGAAIAVVAILAAACLAGLGPTKKTAKKPPAKSGTSEIRLRVGPDELLTVSLYLNRLRDGQPYIAVDEYFDVDGFMARIFGDDARKLMSDEYAYARQMTWVFVKATVTLVPAGEWKQPISIANLKVTRVDAESARVSFARPMGGGDLPFELHRGLKGWRIVDTPPLAESLREEYRRQSEGGRITPVDYLESLVSRTLDQKRKLKDRAPTTLSGQP